MSRVLGSMMLVVVGVVIGISIAALASGELGHAETAMAWGTVLGAMVAPLVIWLIEKGKVKA